MKKLMLLTCLMLSTVNLEALAERGLKLRSQGNMFGPSVAYISENGILVQCKIGKSLWQAKNPGVVTLINDEYKTYLTIPVQEYIDELRGDSPAPKLSNLQVTPQNYLTAYKGRKVECYSQPPTKGKQSTDNLLNRLHLIDNPFKNKEVNRIWCRYVGLERTDLGMPVLLEQKANGGAGDLALSFINGNKVKSNQDAKVASSREHRLKAHKQRWVEELKTTEIVSADFAKDTFAIRSNWHRAKDRPSLYLSQDGDIKPSDIDDLFFRPLK